MMKDAYWQHIIWSEQVDFADSKVLNAGIRRMTEKNDNRGRGRNVI